MTMPGIVPEQPLLLGLLHVHTTIGLDLLASIGEIVSCLFLETDLVGACSGFYSLGCALISCQLFSDVLLGVSMLPEPIGSARIMVGWLLQMNCIAPLFSTAMRSFLHSKIKCKFSSSFRTVLMSSTFDLCLLLYVISLAGWLKRCNVSLSHTLSLRYTSFFLFS